MCHSGVSNFQWAWRLKPSPGQKTHKHIYINQWIHTGNWRAAPSEYMGSNTTHPNGSPASILLATFSANSTGISWLAFPAWQTAYSYVMIDLLGRCVRGHLRKNIHMLQPRRLWVATWKASFCVWYWGTAREEGSGGGWGQKRPQREQRKRNNNVSRACCICVYELRQETAFWDCLQYLDACTLCW